LDLTSVDEAVICTNPELSSCRDSDKMIGFIASKSLRAVNNDTPVNQRLLVTRYDPLRVHRGECLSLDDIKEVLGIPVLGVIPESAAVLTSTNMGQPVIMQEDNAAIAYRDSVKRFLGEEVDLKFLQPEEKGFFSRLFGSR
jgi:septum site-determining protein MinD